MANIYIGPGAPEAANSIRQVIQAYGEASDAMVKTLDQLADTDGAFKKAVEAWKQTDAAARQQMQDAVFQVVHIIESNMENQHSIDAASAASGPLGGM